ncbi:hypothetical protein [Serratia rubidaea]|uniref:hypothetical protein n=1 Tax=Serratia rubidaea TaxID=61652 RepID=UPI0010FCF67C|nr:hypothetical protein [Serratia rubidaea]MBS0973980.1 hypothetical protein [Serratia rubidaea]MDC6110308.1 hypothetical protein [Serratia rubidaea]QPR63291.1 hypothetical protein I6G83_21265 [Serratia rubidaea]HAY0635286.1 hypothetical protein [Serratia rubidaea]
MDISALPRSTAQNNPVLGFIDIRLRHKKYVQRAGTLKVTFPKSNHCAYGQHGSGIRVGRKALMLRVTRYLSGWKTANNVMIFT